MRQTHTKGIRRHCMFITNGNLGNIGNHWTPAFVETKSGDKFHNLLMDKKGKKKKRSNRTPRAAHHCFSPGAEMCLSFVVPICAKKKKTLQSETSLCKMPNSLQFHEQPAVTHDPHIAGRKVIVIELGMRKS